MSKEKIVITGGLGYIGTELCKIYSGEARFKNIVVVDNRFISGQVKQLRDWGIDFVQLDITESSARMHNVFSDATTVYHLAGITDVAYTKTEPASEKDASIIRAAIAGTNNILLYIPNTCKLIFPSTHVVFEGLEEVKRDLIETEPPCPVLTYAKCKFQNELDIRQSNQPHIIVRLGSVYGYSGDSTRINILPNLFSKMASQNQPLKLFARGVQLKTLVSVHDVARCMKTLAEGSIVNETFHLSNENMTVKELALLIKKVGGESVTMVETDDDIPNEGYTMSNKKLLATGFEFRDNIESAVSEMLKRWSARKMPAELEYLQRGQNEFKDDRGKISNFELTEPINLIGLIESKAGTVRANHYHPIQEQKCLLISGFYISVIKDLAEPDSPIITRLVGPGDLAVIQPNVAHAMIFLKDSVVLNLIRGDRDHDKYGVTHTIPYPLVDDKFRIDILKNYVYCDLITGSRNLLDVISLGMSPLANNLLDAPSDNVEMFPLEMKFCPETYNCQLSYVVPPEDLFKHYLYTSSTSKSFRTHFENAAETYITKYNPKFVVDIGSNDGIGLKPFQDRGIKVLGIEPANNIAKLANDNGIPTVNSFFNEEAVEQILKMGVPDIVTASNVFAHSSGLNGIAKLILDMLADTDGVFIIEVQYLVDTMWDLTFDNIYHEHVHYWTLSSLYKFFSRLGATIVDVEHINTHGGSIRVYVKEGRREENPIVRETLDIERELGILEHSTYIDFANRVATAKKNTVENIRKLRAQGKRIVGFGAPAKATTMLNYFGLTQSDIDYVVDDSPLKHNKYIPGVNIPIYPKSKLEADNPDVVLVLAWNFFNEIVKNNPQIHSQFINVKDLMNESTET